MDAWRTVHALELPVWRNPTRASVATYTQRVAQKRYAQRWPQVRIIPC